MDQNSNEPNSQGEPHVYTAPVVVPPPPPSERPASSYLLLAVNLIVLIAAIWWVWHRIHQTPQAPGAGDPQRQVNVDKPPVAPQATGTVGAGGALRGVKGIRRIDPFGNLREAPADVAAGANGNGAARSPALDDATFSLLQATGRSISAVGTQTEVLRAILGRYPSSAQEFGRNRGIEALVEALRKAGRDGSAGNLKFGDTDGDGRDELLDPWGNPLVYFSPDDYGTTQGWAKDGGDAAASKNALTGEWTAKSRFQLWSAGINGKNENGDGDDVTSWEIREKSEMR